MSDQTDQTNICADNWGVPERIAAWAAAAGFTLSAIFLSLHIASANYGMAGLQLRAGLEAAALFFWPSAIFMAGMHSHEGGTILFLLSASLNAVWYVFVSLAAYVIYGKLKMLFGSARTHDLETLAAAHAQNFASARTYQSPKLIRRTHTTRTPF